MVSRLCFVVCIRGLIVSLQVRNFFLGQASPAPLRQISQGEFSHGDTAKAKHGKSVQGTHFSNLSVSSLIQGHFQASFLRALFAEQSGFYRQNGISVDFHRTVQALKRCVADLSPNSHVVDLWDLVSWVSQAVCQSTVIGQQ